MRYYESVSSHIVRTGEFEGPLEVLLSLIEKRKMHISDVALAKVADDFVAYVHSHGEFPVAEAADFVYVASTLLLIKSRSLLPGLELSDEEQGNIDELERRLTLYQQIRDLSRGLMAIYGTRPLYLRQTPRDTTPIFSPPQGLSSASVAEAIRSVIANLPKGFERLPEVAVRKVASLEETIESLANRVSGALKMSFREFSGGGRAEKVEVIVGFLAMLELVKQGILRVSQDERFSDIMMEADSVGVPRY